MKVETAQPEHINIIRWLAGPGVGMSSKCMAFTAMGVKLVDPFDDTPHPHDPGDLNRCLKLLRAAPEVRDAFPAIAALSPVWKALIERWSEIENSFIDEVGFGWSKARSAPITYKLMRDIIDAASRKRRSQCLDGLFAG